MSWVAATSMAGASVTFEAALDCVVVASACPQDIVGINAAGLSPLAIDVESQPHIHTESGES